MTKPISIVDVFVSGYAAKYRLPKLSVQGVMAIVTGTAIREHLARKVGQSKRVVKLTKRQQPSIRSHA